MSNFSFGDLFNYSCPEYGPDSDQLIDNVNFWIEGAKVDYCANTMQYSVCNAYV